MQKVRFVNKDKSGNLFVSTLRKRIDTYFKDRGLSRHHNPTMVTKTVVLLGGYIIPFIVLVTVQPPVGVALVLWAVMGFSLAGVGMSVMHDANHGAYSSNPRVNYVMGHTLNLLGGSVFNWKLQHNTLHHTYTNVSEMDEDIGDKLMLRFSPHTPVKKFHRFQHIYAFLFYGLATVYWAFMKDFDQFFRYTRNGVNRSGKAKNRGVMFRLILSKLAYLAVFFVFPLLVLKLPVGPYVGGYLLMHFIAGIVLTVVFQLAHTVEGTTHPLPDDSGTIENNWAIHQLNTTVNFSRKNKWLSWYVGGLNFQVEHHLFPQICHVHYPALAPIVKKTAEEYGIPYLEQNTFWAALKSHISVLKRFGRPSIRNEVAL